jgi:hypothetical protein
MSRRAIHKKNGAISTHDSAVPIDDVARLGTFGRVRE